MTRARRPAPEATRPAVVDVRPRHVAWATVLLLATAMAFTDLFWVVSLRQVTGAIERTSDPAASWLRESTLLLPAYVVAVLCARAVGRRRDPTRPAGGRVLASTALAVVGFGTLAGVLALAASSVYDYRLEMALLEHTGHTGCVGDCLDAQRTSTAGLQLTSVGYGSAIILVTNLVVVGWLVALLGGRLRLDRFRAPRQARPPTRAHRTGGLTAVVAAGLAGAAVIHVAVVPEHAAEWPAAAGFFVVLAGLQAGAAVAVARRPGRSSWWVAATVSVAPLAIWLWSRTAGLPWGPEAGTAEPLGLADVAAVSLQVTTLVLLGLWARRGRASGGAAPLGGDATRIGLAAVLAITVLGLGGSGIGWLDVTSGVDHAQVDAH